MIQHRTVQSGVAAVRAVHAHVWEPRNRIQVHVSALRTESAGQNVPGRASRACTKVLADPYPLHENKTAAQTQTVELIRTQTTRLSECYVYIVISCNIML